MRRLTYLIAMTVDGYIARTDGSLDFFPMTGDHLPYIASEYPETIAGHLRAPLGAEGGNKHFDAVVMGRRTYEIGSSAGFTSPYPHLRQYVVSTTMRASPDPAVQLVAENAVDFVRALKNENGLGIWLCGGARLAGALYEEIDELIVKINPVMLGAGVPLFRGVDAATTLTLTDHRRFHGGVAIHRYRVVR
jgi:dihydrofolate reductase